MSFIRIATALAATAIASPAFAADVSEPAPFDPWVFYVGVHAGDVWGDGEWELDGNHVADLDGSRAIFGALAGVAYRFDPAFLGIEADVGIATGHFDWSQDGSSDELKGCPNGTWCDLNGHVRLRAGIAVTEGLDVFVAGGIALADGHGDNDDFITSEDPNEDVFVGWSLGFGADYALTDQFKLRVEYLHDDYGHRDPFSFSTDYNSEWADNTVRGAAIFEF
jgi:outer membrane immunogenic protein